MLACYKIMDKFSTNIYITQSSVCQNMYVHIHACMCVYVMVPFSVFADYIIYHLYIYMYVSTKLQQNPRMLQIQNLYLTHVHVHVHTCTCIQCMCIHVYIVYSTFSLCTHHTSYRSVLNTDNMSVVGVTIDYGPYGFLDKYVPGHICNGSGQSFPC